MYVYGFPNFGNKIELRSLETEAESMNSLVDIKSFRWEITSRVLLAKNKTTIYPTMDNSDSTPTHTLVTEGCEQNHRSYCLVPVLSPNFFLLVWFLLDSEHTVWTSWLWLFIILFGFPCRNLSWRSPTPLQVSDNHIMGSESILKWKLRIWRKRREKKSMQQILQVKIQGET